MKSSFRNAAAAVIAALALSLSAYAAEPQSWSDSLRLTSPGATTVSALESFAKANSGTCRGERSAAEAPIGGSARRSSSTATASRKVRFFSRTENGLPT